MRAERWIALLGRRDTPTDGVEDYCSFLGGALAGRGIELRNVRVAWAEEGWLRALPRLWTESAGWRENWVLLQYTTMAWSRRGLPFGALAVLEVLRWRGVRGAVVFHEAFRQDGRRWIDRVRGACQDRVIRGLYRRATKAIFADPLEKITWLRAAESKAVFVPIGPNIPGGGWDLGALRNRNGDARTVAVYCLSDLPNRHRELEDIAHAMRCVVQQGLKARVVFLGRGTPEAKDEIERAFGSVCVEAVNLGLQSGESVGQILSESDAMLCVRGPLYPRRGSAIAGIACGLPIVGYAGASEGTPLEAAGLALVPYLDREALGKALADVLEDSAVSNSLRERSLAAHRTHFSWEVIAASVQKSLSQQQRADE